MTILDKSMISLKIKLSMTILDKAIKSLMMSLKHLFKNFTDNPQLSTAGKYSV